MEDRGSGVLEGGSLEERAHPPQLERTLVLDGLDLLDFTDALLDCADATEGAD